MFLRKLLGSLVVAASVLKYRYSERISPSNSFNQSMTVLQSTEPNCIAVSYTEFDTKRSLSRLSSVLTTSLATLGLTSITPTTTTSTVYHCSPTPTGTTTFNSETPSYLLMSSTSATRHLPRSPWGFTIYIASAAALLSAIVWIVAALSVMRLYSSLTLYCLRSFCVYTVQTMWTFVIRKVLRVPVYVPIGDYIRLDQECAMLAQQLSLLQAGKAASDSANSDLAHQLASLQAKFDHSAQAHIALVEVKDARISHLSSQLDSTRATVKQLESTVKDFEDTVTDRDNVITDLTAQISDVKMQAEVASSRHVTILEVRDAEVDELKQVNTQLQVALSAALEHASALSANLEQTKKANEAKIAVRQDYQRRLEEQAVELMNERDDLTRLVEQTRTENHTLTQQYKSLLDEDDIMIAGLMCQLQDMVNERSEGVTNGRDIHEDETNQPNAALVEEHISPERCSMDLTIPSIVIHPPPIDPPAPPPDIPTSEHTSEELVSLVQSSSGDGRQTTPISGPAREEPLREAIEEFEEHVDPDVTAVDAEDLHETQRFTLGMVPVPGARDDSPDDTLVNTVETADEDYIDYVFEPGSPQWGHVRLQLPDIRQENKAVLNTLDELDPTLEMPKIFAVLTSGHEDHLNYTSDPDDGCSSKRVENSHVRELYRSDVAGMTAIDHEGEAKLGDINSLYVNDERPYYSNVNGSRAGSTARPGDGGSNTSRVGEDKYASSDDGCTSNRKPSHVGSFDPFSLEESPQERERAVLRLKELCVMEDDGLNELVNELILSFESPESNQLSSIADGGSDSTSNCGNEDDVIYGEAESESRLHQPCAGTQVDDIDPAVWNFEGADQSERMKEELDASSSPSKTTRPLRNRPYKGKPVNHEGSLSPSNASNGQQQRKRSRSCGACCSPALSI